MRVFLVHERLRDEKLLSIVFFRRVFDSEEKAKAYIEKVIASKTEEQIRALKFLGVVDQTFTITEAEVE